MKDKYLITFLYGGQHTKHETYEFGNSYYSLELLAIENRQVFFIFKIFLHEIIFLENFHYLKIGWVTWVPYLHHELIAILKFEYYKNEMQKNIREI
jgi:hypothetical protein